MCNMLLLLKQTRDWTVSDPVINRFHLKPIIREDPLAQQCLLTHTDGSPGFICAVHTHTYVPLSVLIFVCSDFIKCTSLCYYSF